MRKRLGLALSLIGAFLVVVAILAQTWAASALMKTPLDVDSTTLLSGTAEISGTSTDVRGFSVTRADSAKSDGDVVLFQSSSCLVRDEGDPTGCVDDTDPQERLITASESSFATDRKTALAVNDPKFSEAGAEAREGLINKWPFESEKKTYPYWDGLIGGTVDAVYDRTEDLDGLEIYVYIATVEDVSAEISEGIEGTYSSTREFWVEPLTGALVNQIDQQERVTSEGEPFLSIDLEFTEDQQEESLADAKDNVSRLNLVRRTIPIVGYVVGIPLLLGGIALSVLAGRRRDDGGDPTGRRAKVPSDASA